MRKHSCLKLSKDSNNKYYIKQKKNVLEDKKFGQTAQRKKKTNRDHPIGKYFIQKQRQVKKLSCLKKSSLDFKKLNQNYREHQFFKTIAKLKSC